jgi:anti-anti-sigma factor
MTAAGAPGNHSRPRQGKANGHMHETQLTEYTTSYPDPEGFWTGTINGMPVVTAHGDVDIANKDAMRRELLTACTYSTVVAVDLAESFLDVPALRVLAEIARMLANGGGELRAVITRPQMLLCLEITRYGRQLRTFPSLSAAVGTPRQDCEIQFLAA